VIGDADQALIDEWQSACRTAYRAIFPSVVTPIEVLTARHICGAIPLRAAVEEVETTANQAGTRVTAGQMLASWLASLTSVRTASAGKSRRGRFFLGGMVEDDVAGATISGSYLTAVNAYAQALLNTFGPAGTSTNWKWVVHSHALSKTGPSVPCQNSSTPVTGFIVRNLMTTMKSRRAGSGN
jgi:hypothetical protein